MPFFFIHSEKKNKKQEYKFSSITISWMNWSQTTICLCFKPKLFFTLIKYFFFFLIFPASLSRALTMPRSTWVEPVMRPPLLPRRPLRWGCLCEMLLCHCHWIRKFTRMGRPARGLHPLTYTKEGKTLINTVYLHICLNVFLLPPPGRGPYYQCLSVCLFSVSIYNFRQITQNIFFLQVLMPVTTDVLIFGLLKVRSQIEENYAKFPKFVNMEWNQRK